MQAHNLAHMLIQFLCPVLIATVTHGDEQVAVFIKHNAWAKVFAGTNLWRLAKDDFFLNQGVAFEFCAHYFCAYTTITFARVADVYPTVFRICWMQDNIHQAALTTIHYFWCAADWVG